MSAASWFNNLILNELQWMATLSLRGTPPPDVLPATAEAWVQSLWGMPLLWDQERDEWRLKQAFGVVRANSEFWPAPVAVYRSMPPMRERRALPPPKTPPPPDRKAALKAISQRIALKLTSSPVKLPQEDNDVHG